MKEHELWKARRAIAETRKRKWKIFVVGSAKTSITSVMSALETLGFRMVPKHIASLKGTPHMDEFIRGEYERLFRLIGEYDGACDRPWNHGDFYKTLDVRFPGSRFILTVRDTDKWMDSYRRWSKKFTATEDIKRYQISPEAVRLPDGSWKYTVLSKPSYSPEDWISDEDKMRLDYEARNREVVDYFAGRDNLLVMNVENGDGWDCLCRFLGKPVPQTGFPHDNKTSELR